MKLGPYVFKVTRRVYPTVFRVFANTLEFPPHVKSKKGIAFASKLESISMGLNG
jgi:hypothetical protein